MNYESIILELMSRVQTLENEVKELKEKNYVHSSMNGSGLEQHTAKLSDVKRTKDYIEELMNTARENGETELILRAGDIQRELGIKNRPATICSAMYQLKKDSDVVLEAPPSGKSTTVLIKYYL